jgi:hypothetical protein
MTDDVVQRSQTSADGGQSSDMKPRLILDLDALPDETSDDLAQSWGESTLDDVAKERRYLAEKPPHHGD